MWSPTWVSTSENDNIYEFVYEMIYDTIYVIIYDITIMYTADITTMDSSKDDILTSASSYWNPKRKQVRVSYHNLP